MSGPGGIDWSRLVGNRQDIRFARANLPAVEYAANLARERAACVQAGGNIGVFPLFLAQCFERVITFEPSRDALEDFYENMLGQEMPLPNIDMREAGLGERPGRAWLHAYRRDGRPGHSGTYHVTLADELSPGEVVGGAEIVLETIDQLKLERCGLIYLDIEGFELYALRGAAATVERCRPVIGVEINKNLDRMDYSAADLIEWIGSRRYRPAASIGSDMIFAPAEWGSA